MHGLAKLSKSAINVLVWQGTSKPLLCHSSEKIEVRATLSILTGLDKIIIFSGYSMRYN